MKAASKKASHAKKRLVILDSHAILHRAFHALPDFVSSKGEPTGALYGIASMLIKIVNELRPDYLVACYDLPQPTYRHEAYDKYKAGRKKTDEGLIAQIERSRDLFAAFNIPLYEKVGFEADDLIGTIVAQVADTPDLDVVIASGDMDTLQLVRGTDVRVYTLKRGLTDTIIYDEAAVVDRFGFAPLLLPDYKGLRGDPSDNIPGVPGIGEKTGSELIQNFGTIEALFKTLKKDPEALKKAGIKDRIIKILSEHEEEAVFSKMLGTIRRDVPVTFTLADQSWPETFQTEPVLKLFSELEFRTLGARLKEMFGAKSIVDEGAPVPEVPAEDSIKEESLPEDEIRKLRIALWLLDSTITEPEPEDMLRFAKTESLQAAKETILKEVAARNLTRVFEEIELPLMPVIDAMHERGIRVDLSALADLSKEYHDTLSKIEKSIFTHAGQTFNVNSPRQLGDILFDKLGLSARTKKTPGGARSTRESELEKLKDLHPIVAEILEYRQFQKLLSTYIDTIPHLVDGAGRLHSTLSQTGTTTGRMSSQNPNLQNIPVKSDLGRRIRTAFIAEKGFSFVSIDYSQIELRIAAILSGDVHLAEIFEKGEDLHGGVASRIFGVPPEDVTKAMRSKAKVINFGVLYGMGVNALRQNMGSSRDEAQQAYEEYFKNFSGLASYIEETKAFVEAKGYTETLFGRRRYFEGIRSRLPFIKAAAERMAVNAPIQGSQADIIKLAMIGIENYVKKENLSSDVLMTLQVHDELLFEIKSDRVKEVVPKLKKIMESVLPTDMSRGIPIVAEAKAGSSWGDLKPFV